MTGWRDLDSPGPRLGLVLSKHGASLYVGKRLYRCLWRTS